MATKSIVVETTRAVGTYPKGAQLGFDSEAKARSVLDDAFKVTGYQDGTEYEEKPAAKSTSKTAKAEDATDGADS